MLHRYLTPQKFVSTSPPEVGTGWPQVSTYNGIRDQPVLGAGGVDLSNPYVYIVTFSRYQWTISNTVNYRKAGTIFYYELTPTGELVSSSPTNILSQNYTHTQTSWTRFVFVGASPVSRTIAVTRQNGADSQNSFGNWNSTTSTTTGQIMYHNGSSWSAVGVGQGWVMQPVWNAAGTHIAAPLTASTGPGTPISIGLTGWNGTAVTGTSSITIANATYVRDCIWVGDTLVVIGTGSSGGTLMTFLERSGNTFSQVGQYTFADEYINKLTPDSLNPNRFFAGVSQRLSTPSSTTNPLLSIIYNGAGSITVNSVAASAYPGNSGTTAFPVYPMKDNNLLLTRNVANPNPSFFSTTPTSASQIPYNGSSFQGASGDVFVEAQPFTGAVVMVNSASNNLRIQKIS